MHAGERTHNLLPPMESHARRAIKYHSISVYQSRYATSIVARYLDTATLNTSTKFYKTTFTSGIIFTKAHASTSDDKLRILIGNSIFTVDLTVRVNPTK